MIMLIGLTSAWQLFVTIIGYIWEAYTLNAVLSAFFTLWVLDRIFGIFDLIKG